MSGICRDTAAPEVRDQASSARAGPSRDVARDVAADPAPDPARDPARDPERPTGSPRDDPPSDWVAALSSSGTEQAAALAHLHALMLRAARHQVWRMRSQLGDVGATTIDVLVNQSADEAMAVLLRKLHTFEGRSRFTTWAYKFAVLQAAAEVRRTAWRSRDVELHDVDTLRDPAASPSQEAEATDLARALVEAMTSVLTLHQRRITIALAVELVPVDVLAERLGTTRGALYKTLHDARTRMRAELVRTGYLPAPDPGAEAHSHVGRASATGVGSDVGPGRAPTPSVPAIPFSPVLSDPDQEVTP